MVAFHFQNVSLYMVFLTFYLGKTPKLLGEELNT